MTISKALKLPAILFAAAQIFCACSKETPPPIYDAPLFESQADFREKRTLDFVCAKNFSAVGAAVGFSETKNVARLFFTDLQRAFTEVDFFADGKKRKIVSRESADANSARFSLENGGTLSLKKLENGMMKFRAEFENAREVSMSFIMPNEFFAGNNRRHRRRALCGFGQLGETTARKLRKLRENHAPRRHARKRVLYFRRKGRSVVQALVREKFCNSCGLVKGRAGA